MGHDSFSRSQQPRDQRSGPWHVQFQQRCAASHPAPAMSLPVTWPIHKWHAIQMWHDSLIRGTTDSYMRHDVSMWNMAHSYVIYLTHMSQNVSVPMLLNECVTNSLMDVTRTISWISYARDFTPSREVLPMRHEPYHERVTHTSIPAQRSISDSTPPRELSCLNLSYEWVSKSLINQWHIPQY